MIKNYTQCGKCEHNKVCQYKKNVEEILIKTNGHLDNLYVPEIFKINFECKEYKEKEEITKKENPWA